MPPRFVTIRGDGHATGCRFPATWFLLVTLAFAAPLPSGEMEPRQFGTGGVGRTPTTSGMVDEPNRSLGFSRGTPEGWPWGGKHAAEFVAAEMHEPASPSAQEGRSPWPFAHPIRRGDPDDPGRHQGMGVPLAGTSWLNRPFHAGWMLGGMIGDDLIGDELESEASFVGGYRVGWDFDHYWGLEGRFVFANPSLSEAGNPLFSGTSMQRYWDADLVYYPWGDARWRPYASLGVGWATFDLRDAAGQNVDKSLLTIPIGVGLKYYWKHWLALRFSITDNWAIGRQPLSTMHHVSLTGDVEVRLGRRRLSYFPYHGGIEPW